MPKPSPFRLLLRLAARYPWRVAIGLGMAVLGTLLGFAPPNTTRWIIDEVIPHRDIPRLWQLTWLTLGAMFLRQVLYSLRTLANSAFYLRMTYDLRSSRHEKIQRLPLKWFDLAEHRRCDRAHERRRAGHATGHPRWRGSVCSGAPFHHHHGGDHVPHSMWLQWRLSSPCRSSLEVRGFMDAGSSRGSLRNATPRADWRRW